MDNKLVMEECFKVIPDHFKLVVLASYRANAISSGSSVEIDKGDNKSPCIALKEIAMKKVDEKLLEQAVIKSFQKYAYLDESEYI